MEQRDLSYSFFKVSLLLFLMFVSAINYNLFINPIRIVAGGVNGLSNIFQTICGVNPAITMLIIFGATLIVGVILKEYELILSALVASFVYPLFVQITVPLNGMVFIQPQDYLIVAVFSGVISGIVSGATCKLDISQGGITLIAQIISKHLRIDVSKVSALLNGAIVLGGAFVFGVNNVLFAVIYLFSNKMVMNRIIIGSSQKKLFQIITKEDRQVVDYITTTLNSGVTIFNTKGGIASKNRTVIMTSISNRDYFKLKEGIHNIDKEAFVLITDSYQVRGGK